MEEKKVVTLDLMGCKYWWEVHQRIKQAFDFPDFYGQNWDAFWDLLCTECDANRIIVVGIETMPKEFERHAGKILEILQRLKDHRAKYDESIEIEICS